MSKFLLYDRVVLERWENYQKGSYRNKCRILGPNGPLLLSVPLVSGKHQQQRITEVRISYHQSWYAQHWHAIRTAYGSAPFFGHYGSRVQEILYFGYEKLFALNDAMLRLLTEAFSLPEPLYTEKYVVTPAGCLDLRDQLNRRVPHADPTFIPRPYTQVFKEKFGFTSNLSCLDLLFCLGPEGGIHLERCLS